MNPLIPSPDDPCGGPLGGMICGGNPLDPQNWFTDAIVATAEAVLRFAFALLDWVWNLITTVTQPRTDAAFLSEWAGRVFAITLPLTVMFLVFQVITVVLRTRSTEGLGKAVAMAGVSVIGTYASLPFIHIVTSAVDALADDLTAITFGSLEDGGNRFVGMLRLVLGIFANPFSDRLLGPQLQQLGAGSAIAGAIGFIIFGLFLVFGSMAVFAALLIRTMLLYIVIVMGPIAIMGLAWERTRGWFRVWVGIVVALILSKLAIMIVFGLGVSVLESGLFERNGAGMAGVMLTGALILMVAALMPVACFKFISFIGDEIQAGRMHSDSSATVARVGTVAQRAGSASILHFKQNAQASDDRGREGRSTPTHSGHTSDGGSSASELVSAGAGAGGSKGSTQRPGSNGGTANARGQKGRSGRPGEGTTAPGKGSSPGEQRSRPGGSASSSVRAQVTDRGGVRRTPPGTDAAGGDSAQRSRPDLTQPNE